MAVDPNSPVIPNPADGPQKLHGSDSGLKQTSPSASPDSTKASVVEIWIHRLNALSFVFLCGTLGVLLIIVPWWPQWTDNYLLFRFPQLREFISSGFVRGVCSGFGILDVWIGFWHAMTYREDTPS